LCNTHNMNITHGIYASYKYDIVDRLMRKAMRPVELPHRAAWKRATVAGETQRQRHDPRLRGKSREGDLINRPGADRSRWWSSSTQPVDRLPARQQNRRHVVDRELQRQRLGLTDLILCEVLQGISGAERVRAGPSDLLKFQVFETAAGPAIAAAQSYRTCASALHRHKTIDCLIALFACRAGTNCCIAITISML